MAVTPKEQEELAARLTFLRTETNFPSWREFAAEAGLSPSFFTSKLSQLLAGTGSSINGKAAAAIIDACDQRGVRVPLRWLLRGEGPAPEVTWRRRNGVEVPVPQAPMVDPAEIEHARATGPGRWKHLAARYATFRRIASLAASHGVADVVLDAAADEIGVHKGDGPTEKAVEEAIERAVSDHARLGERFRGARSPGERDPLGREATSEDFKAPPPEKKKRR